MLEETSLKMDIQNSCSCLKSDDTAEEQYEPPEVLPEDHKVINLKFSTRRDRLIEIDGQEKKTLIPNFLKPRKKSRASKEITKSEAILSNSDNKTDGTNTKSVDKSLENEVLSNGSLKDSTVRNLSLIKNEIASPFSPVNNIQTKDDKIADKQDSSQLISLKGPQTVNSLKQRNRQDSIELKEPNKWSVNTDKNEKKSFEPPKNQPTLEYSSKKSMKSMNLSFLFSKFRESTKIIRDDTIGKRVRAGQGPVMWCTLSEVLSSGVLDTIGPKDKFIQEAMMEVITSEAKFQMDLDIILNHYYLSPLFIITNDKFGYINPIDKHFIFSNIAEIRNTSQKLMDDFENRWTQDKPYLSDICDIIFHHATRDSFKEYVIYLRNQPKQIQVLNKLCTSQVFKKQLSRLEEYEISKGLPFESYLLTPMQRLTRLKLLCENILKGLIKANMGEHGDQIKIYNANLAIKRLIYLLENSQKGKSELDNSNLLKDIVMKIDYPKDYKKMTLNGKLLIRVSEFTFNEISPTLPLKQKQKEYVTLLFNDTMMIAKKVGSRIQVIDICNRKNVFLTTCIRNFTADKDTGYVFNNMGGIEDEENKIILRFEDSATKFMKDPIMLKAEDKSEIEILLRYIPDFMNAHDFDLSRKSNASYWKPNSD